VRYGYATLFLFDDFLMKEILAGRFDDFLTTNFLTIFFFEDLSGRFEGVGLTRTKTERHALSFCGVSCML